MAGAPEWSPKGPETRTTALAGSNWSSLLFGPGADKGPWGHKENVLVQGVKPYRSRTSGEESRSLRGQRHRHLRCSDSYPWSHRQKEVRGRLYKPQLDQPPPKVVNTDEVPRLSRRSYEQRGPWIRKKPWLLPSDRRQRRLETKSIFFFTKRHLSNSCRNLLLECLSIKVEGLFRGRKWQENKYGRESDETSRHSTRPHSPPNATTNPIVDRRL